MTAIPNSTTVSAPIAPSDTGDQYPTHYARYGNGGLMAVANEAARLALPTGRREEGMWVQQVDTGAVWRLIGGIANGNWAEVTMTMANIVGLVAALAAKENSLGNPSINGQALVSTTGGARSWISLGDAGDIGSLVEANYRLITVDISAGNVALEETTPFAGILFIGSGTPGPIQVSINDSLFEQLPMNIGFRNNSSEIVRVCWESNTGSYVEIAAGGTVSLGSFIEVSGNKYAVGYFDAFATIAYADSLVTGLLDDRGNYDASGNTYPATGGSGTAGAIKKGDVWYISVQGILGGVEHLVGSSIRALVDTPGQTAANWASVGTNLGYVPEDAANKQNNLTSSATKYPTVDAVNTGLGTKQDRYLTVAAVSSASNVVTIDLSSTTNLYTLDLTENVTSWVFSNPPAAGKVRDIEVRVTQHASAAKTVVSPATSGRTAGGAWTVSSTVSSIETLGIRVFSDGTVDLFPSGVFA